MKFNLKIYFVDYKNNNIFAIGFGEILKRPTRADCKSADYVFAGSNPALPTKKQAETLAFLVLTSFF